MDKKVLLIADDDGMNRLIIRKFLSSTYQVKEADNGKKALEILRSEHVDLLLLDIIMPEVDGFEVLEQLRKDEKLNTIGVLVATSTKEKTERQALALGADDIVSKPYDPIVIKKRLENISALKTITEQQHLLKTDNVQAFVDKKISECFAEIKPSLVKLDKYASIIRANKSNFKLVDEIIDDLNAETKKISSILGEDFEENSTL